MKIKADTILASFVVALFSSLLTALAVLLVEILSTSLVRAQFIADLVVNIYILFFLSGFVFFKGSSIAAWLLYRHDVEWGYKIKYRQVMPIFIISFSMAVVVYFAAIHYMTSEVSTLAYLERSRALIEQARPF